MPGTSRSTKLGGCSNPTRAITVLATSALATSAWADAGAGVTGSLSRISWHDLTALALVLGIALFAIVSAVMLLRTRARAAAERVG
jgi:hypothetical protein